MWISPIFFSLFSLSLLCVRVGENRSALFSSFSFQRRRRRRRRRSRSPRERDCWEKRFPPVSFFFRSFVLSLSLSKKKERFKKSKKSGLVSSEERGLTKQRDLIREERLVLPKARSISVSFSVLSIIIIANDLLTLTFKDVLQEQTSEHDRPHG